MVVITENSMNPIKRLECILRCIEGSKYPNEASIIDDDLRSSLQTAYKLNLNLCDTYRIKFRRIKDDIYINNEPDEFYVYECSCKSYIFNDKNYASDFDLYGNYPEGIFLGFMHSEFRDKEYIKDHISAYFMRLFIMGKSYLTTFNHPSDNYAEAYRYYLNHMPFLFAIKNTIEKVPEFDLEEIKGLIEEDAFELFNYCLTKDKNRFLKVVSSYNYAEYYRYYLDIINEMDVTTAESNEDNESEN